MNKEELMLEYLYQKMYSYQGRIRTLQEVVNSELEGSDTCVMAEKGVVSYTAKINALFDIITDVRQNKLDNILKGE